MDEKLGIIIPHIRNIIFSEEFKNNFKLKKTYFTRNRKVGFVSVVLIILNLIRKSTQIEIDDFLKYFVYGDIYFTYTKQSFSKARQKISKEAFKYLNQSFINKFYEGNYKKYKNYRLLAMDGSIIDLPDNKETQNKYGFVTNGRSNFKLARAISSTLYDLMNDVLVNSLLGRYDIGERELAIKNIEELLSVENKNIESIILFDKAYPSLAFFEYLNSNNIKFFMRAKPNFYTEGCDGETFDKIIKVEITKQRCNDLKRQGFRTKVGQIFTFRMLKLIINSEPEIVVTNLTSSEISSKDAVDLFYKRWGIETKFNELKNRFEIENFSGTKPVTIEQDFFATHLVSNIAGIIAIEATKKIERNKKLNTIHRYKVNKNILIGKLKNTLIEILTFNISAITLKLYNRLIFDIKRNIIPIIRGRNFPVKRGTWSNKYHNNLRRAY
jgi:hypothetical protein